MLKIKIVHRNFYDYCSIFLRLWVLTIFVSIISCTHLLGRSARVQKASPEGPGLNSPDPSSLSRLVIHCQVQKEPRACVPGLNLWWPKSCWGVCPCAAGTDGSPGGVHWEGRWDGMYGVLSYGVYVVIQTLALVELENRREKIHRGQTPPGLHAGTDRARDKTLDSCLIYYKLITFP